MDTALVTTHDSALTTAHAERAERVRRYVKASKAENTLRMYASAWADFEHYCQRRGYASLPADEGALIDYLTALADAGARVATIEQRRAAIGWMHEQHEQGKHPNPAKSANVKETMKGIRRALGARAQPKTAMTLDNLRRIVSSLPDDLRGTRDRALILCGYWGAFRRSELVALKVQDLSAHGNGFTVLIERSKTDQEAEGKYKQLERLTDATVCPVSALTSWLDAATINSGHVFRAIDRWGHTRNAQMDGGEVARIVKRACKAAGIDWRSFAGHSLRSGFVADSTNAGASDGDIMEQTGHESAATLRRYKQMAGLGARRAIAAIMHA